jgi:hypothetical protein
MKQATAEQIADWTQALVTLAQANLPWDHPLCSIGPGRYSYPVHDKAARAALKQMQAHGVTPPSEDEIRRLANGGIDIEAFRAHARLRREVHDMLQALEPTGRTSLAELTALADALRPAVERMRSALLQTETDHEEQKK